MTSPAPLEDKAITVIHKFIRAELFGFSQVLAQAEPTHLPMLNQTLAALMGLLHGHAAQEDQAFGPLLQQAGAALAEQMQAEHQGLDAQLGQIAEQLAQLEPEATGAFAGLQQLYLDWNRFVSAYLQHLDIEERQLFVAIAEQMPALSLVAQSAAAQPPEQRQAFLSKLQATVAAREYAQIAEALSQV